MNKKITYLFGAGASYGALPMDKELCVDMIRFPSYYNYSVHGYDIHNHDLPNPYTLGSAEFLLFEIMRLGYKAKDNNSIDNFAQALMNDNRLDQLKMVLSSYFTLVTHLRRSEFIGEGNVKRKIEKIDPRIYQLIAKSIDINTTNTRINRSINILTWNYDIQIELAMQKYLTTVLSGEPSLSDINQLYLKYIPGNAGINLQQQVWHLNGISGHYKLSSNGRVLNLVDRMQNNSQSPIDSIKFISDSLSKGNITFSDLMCFGWEWNDYIKVLKEDLLKAIVGTDILVVVGYSFPDRNLDFDRTILDHMLQYNKELRIVIHDNNTEVTYFSERMKVEPCKIQFKPTHQIDSYHAYQ